MLICVLVSPGWSLGANIENLFDLIPAVVASLLDFDHFVTARSLSIRKLTQLKEQAIMHNLLVPLGLGAIYLLVRNHSYKRAYVHVITLCLCLVVHLYRDGQRRGVALGPFRSPPLRRDLYLFLIVSFVSLTAMLTRQFGLEAKTNTVEVV